MPQVWFGHGLLERLGHIVPRYVNGQVCVVADQHTEAIAHGVAEALAGCVGAVFIHPGRLKAAQAAVRQVQEAARASAGVVSVGSGCITDVARLAAFRSAKPLVAVATAASMDGYLSGHSPIIVSGYKLTHPARPPKAVVADLQVLAAAPARLTRAGFGDVIGKITALADWCLGHVMTDEYWCPAISKMVHAAVERCRQRARHEVSDLSRVVEEIMEALLITGQAMVYAGNSRPASGGEHHISHYWEMQALARGEEGCLHGEYVAVGTVLLAAVYRAVLEKEHLAPSAEVWRRRIDRLSDRQIRRKRLEAGYGEAAAEVEGETQDKDARNLGTLSHKEAEARWASVRGLLAEAVPEPRQLVDLLRAHGVAATPPELGITEEDTEKALLYARELRNRFGILDLAAAAGCLESVARTVARDCVRW